MAGKHGFLGEILLTKDFPHTSHGKNPLHSICRHCCCSGKNACVITFRISRKSSTLHLWKFAEFSRQGNITPIIRNFFLPFFMCIQNFSMIIFKTIKGLWKQKFQQQRRVRTRVLLVKTLFAKDFSPLCMEKSSALNSHPKLLEFFGLTLIINYQVVTNGKIYILQLSTRS